MDNFSIIFFIIILVSVFSLSIYFVVLFLYPEWIGISGKSAKKIDEELKEESKLKTQD